LIGPSFKHGLMVILVFAVVMSVIAAIASALRGEKFVHVDEESKAQKSRLTAHARAVPDGDGISRDRLLPPRQAQDSKRTSQPVPAVRSPDEP
jgi:hypothetical protein